MGSGIMWYLDSDEGSSETLVPIYQTITTQFHMPEDSEVYAVHLLWKLVLLHD
jgi:hypothetical protein